MLFRSREKDAHPIHVLEEVLLDALTVFSLSELGVDTPAAGVDQRGTRSRSEEAVLDLRLRLSLEFRYWDMLGLL